MQAAGCWMKRRPVPIHFRRSNTVQPAAPAPTTPGAIDTSFNGFWNAFVAKLRADGIQFDKKPGATDLSYNQKLASGIWAAVFAAVLVLIKPS